MQTNTVQTLIDSVKDLTGLTNLSTAKAIRALNFGVDDYSRLTILASGKWRQDSTNHGNVSRITTTLSSGATKLSLPAELIAIRQVEVLQEGKYLIVEPTDVHEHPDYPLSSKYSESGLPKYYDYDSSHLYFYPTSDEARTVRVTYSRAHPRFDTGNLSQDTGVLQIDEEYVVLYAADYCAVGASDSARVAIAQKLADKKRDVMNTFSNLDQDTPRRLKPSTAGPFTNSFKRT